MPGSVCWMCGNASETGEHRIKKSDVVQRFGKGPFRGDSALVHVKEGKLRDLQGPDSQLIKYEKNLCAHCNNTVSQPFDKAYEEFVPWVMAHEVTVLKRRTIDFEDVYGAEWSKKQRDLFKFFAKCFGCRIDEAGHDVPEDVVELMGKDSFDTAFYVTFSVNEDQLLLDSDDQAIGTHDLYEHTSSSAGSQSGYQCGNHYRWLTMTYWYNHFPLEPVGAPWIANSKFLYLGWHQPLSNDEREDLLSKVVDLR